MDLLYRDQLGGWHIVDFKTDAIATEQDLKLLVAGKYGTQMRRYRDAVQRLLGATAECTLCFLNYAGNTAWITVE